MFCVKVQVQAVQAEPPPASSAAENLSVKPKQAVHVTAPGLPKRTQAAEESALLGCLLKLKQDNANDTD